MKRVFTVGFLLLCVFVPLRDVFALTLDWDRNTETDLQDYTVYACFTPGCTVAVQPALKIGTVPQSAVGVRPSFVLPPSSQGKVGVTASDTTGNQSGLSVTVPFDSLPPIPPVNLKVSP